MLDRKERVSFVFPVYNEEENIDPLYRQVKEACAQAKADYEMIFVDDGSSDNSLGIVKRLRKSDPGVAFISLSRNFGHQNAIFAGLSYASGDAVITMDADLQHPPQIIPKMIDMWRNGTEVVYTIKGSARLPFVKNLIVRCSYRFISWLSGLDLHFGQSDFRLIDRQVLDIILSMPEYHKFLRGQVSWAGFKQEGVSYDVQKRLGGKPKFSYGSLYRLALDGIFSFGRYPLHLVMLFGLIIFGASFVYMSAILLIWMLDLLRLVHIPFPSGWTTTVMAILFLGSIQIMTLGIVSEYVGRIYDQTKGRPVFIVREKEVNKKA